MDLFLLKLFQKRQLILAVLKEKCLPCMPMYAKNLNTRDISAMIDDIYGFKLSHFQISIIIDSILEELAKWPARPLKKFYTFFFVDCIYINIRHDYETINCPVYVVPAYDLSGKRIFRDYGLMKKKYKSVA